MSGWVLSEVPAVEAGVVTFTPDDGSDMVVFQEATGGVHLLSGSSSLLWASIDGARSAGEVAGVLAGVCGVPVAVVESDVLAALDEMLALRLVCSR